MFTKLGKILNKNIFVGNSNLSFLPLGATDNTGINTGLFSAKDYFGETHYVSPKIYAVGNSLVPESMGATGNTGGFALGSGGTAPTENDYCLESRLTSGFTASFGNPANAYDSVNKKFYSFINITVTNTSAETIVIREVGRIGVIESAASEGGALSAGRYRYLLDRVVLDNPVTIEAGTSALIVYKTDFPSIE